MRGRIGWWRKVRQPDGSVTVLSEEQAQARILRWRSLFHDINADVLNTPEEVAEEKRRRIRSEAFADVRRRGVQERVINGRADVKERALRIDLIARHIQAKKWEGRSASWIAGRLAHEWQLSPNTLRQDAAAAKKLMGSQRPKN